MLTIYLGHLLLLDMPKDVEREQETVFGDSVFLNSNISSTTEKVNYSSTYAASRTI